MLPIQRHFSARRASAVFTLALLLGLSACGSLRDATTGMSTLGGLVKPYKIDVVQGNVITKEQVGALKTGMTRVEVRDVLGTPLLQSVFHATAGTTYSLTAAAVKPSRYASSPCTSRATTWHAWRLTRCLPRPNSWRRWWCGR